MKFIEISKPLVTSILSESIILESKDGKKYEASGVTIQDAMDKWYQSFSKELGGG